MCSDFVAWFAIATLVAVAATAPQQTDRPIIGVLTTPTLSGEGCVTFSAVARNHQSHGGGSCFHSLYVKWIESAGGRVVPLLYDSSPAALDELFNSLNGVLFTGGETNVSDLDSQYMTAASQLLNRTLEANKRGAYVPLWGTCMGMQTLTNLVSNQTSLLKHGVFDSESLMLPIDLPSPDMKTESRILRAMPKDVLTWLTTENVTTNLHHDGVLPEAYQTNRNLAKFFRVVSTNKDRAGKEFVSTIEAYRAPIYAAQWHPERPQFQFSDSAGETGINHSPHAIRAMQAMANFFVDEARQNSHHFPSKDKETAQLIYNYESTGPMGDSYRIYHFPPASILYGGMNKSIFV